MKRKHSRSKSRAVVEVLLFILVIALLLIHFHNISVEDKSALQPSAINIHSNNVQNGDSADSATNNSRTHHQRLMPSEADALDRADKPNQHPAKREAAVKHTRSGEALAVDLHIVCSSDCTPYQRWQVIVQVHSARAVGQAGKYSWLVSGCSAAGEEDTRKAVVDNFPDAGQRPDIHFTPDFTNMAVYGGLFADGSVKRTFKNRKGQVVKSPYGNRYHFNNKPNSLRHWAERRYGGDASGTQGPYENEVVVLIDPDFVFLRRLDHQEGASTPRSPSPSSSGGGSALLSLVRPSFPAAQPYGLGDQWLSFNLTAICGLDSPCTRVTSSDVFKHYSVGPPYLIHAADVLELATEWSRFVPPTYDQYPMLYAEMFAYSMAAAHLGLKHHLLKGLMTGCMVGWPKVSSGDNSSERKAFSASLEALSEREVQEKSGVATNSTMSTRTRSLSAGGASSCFEPGYSPPPFLHYCQHYQSASGLGHFGKRAVPHNVLECKSTTFATKPKTGDRHKRGGSGRRVLLGKKAAGRDHATGAMHNDVSLGWNALAYCAVVRGIDRARDQRCLFATGS